MQKEKLSLSELDLYEVLEGQVTSAGSDYSTVRYEDSTGNPQLLYVKPGLKFGDKVKIIVAKEKED